MKEVGYSAIGHMGENVEAAHPFFYGLEFAC